MTDESLAGRAPSRTGETARYGGYLSGTRRGIALRVEVSVGRIDQHDRSAAICVGGTAGVEAASGWWAQGHGSNSTALLLVSTVEEDLEMGGTLRNPRRARVLRPYRPAGCASRRAVTRSFGAFVSSAG